MENQLNTNFSQLKNDVLLPLEEMLETGQKRSQISIGIPGEIQQDETRVGLIPEGVRHLSAHGNRILVQSGSGMPAHFTDHEYSEAGAEIVSTASEVFKADIILKISPPTPEEMDMMRARQVVISTLHWQVQPQHYFRKLINHKITAIAFEYLKDKAGYTPVVRGMGEIAGTTAIHIAAMYLSDAEIGRGIMLGGFTGISPTEVVIIGAGTVGEFAARSALALGAMVKVFDDNLYKLRSLQQNIGHKIFTSILSPSELEKALLTADVAIGAIYSGKERTPMVVSESMVSRMKAGAVIVDVSIDQGGCFETSRLTTHSNPVFKKYDVIHYCVPNIGSRVPRTASKAFSNVFTPLLLKASELGGFDNLLRQDFPIRQGVYLYNGILTNQQISDYYNLPFKDIELLMAAFH